MLLEATQKEKERTARTMRNRCSSIALHPDFHQDDSERALDPSPNARPHQPQAAFRRSVVQPPFRAALRSCSEPRVTLLWSSAPLPKTT